MKDQTVMFSADDPAMNAAIQQAKATFGQFLQIFFKRSPNQTAFLIKAFFVSNGQSEHIWVADLVFTGDSSHGVLANEPTLPGMKFKQEVKFHPSQITDWMDIEDGYLVGGYTTRLIRDRLSPDERKTLDAHSPFKIRETV
jgi:uncharacterized protein YegJ (DUF2314 family)